MSWMKYRTLWGGVSVALIPRFYPSESRDKRGGGAQGSACSPIRGTFGLVSALYDRSGVRLWSFGVVGSSVRVARKRTRLDDL